MRFIFTALLLFACTRTNAQLLSKNTGFPHRNQLKFSIFPLHDPFNPGFEFSYERQYRDRWATQASFTFLSNGLHELFDSEKEFHGFKGYRIGVEQKYFHPIKRERSTRRYFAADLNLLEARTIRTTYSESRPVNPVDRMNIDRRIVTLNLKYGFEIPIRRRFVLDLSAGPGLKYRKISNDKNYIGGWRSDWDVNKIYAPREDVAGNFAVSVKVGYMF